MYFSAYDYSSMIIVSIHIFVVNYFQSEKNGFPKFHLYVCAALLVKFSDEIRLKKDFQVTALKRNMRRSIVLYIVA